MSRRMNVRACVRRMKKKIFLIILLPFVRFSSVIIVEFWKQNSR